jgi:glycosyltransferase involved in cell wall biosynthesis
MNIGIVTTWFERGAAYVSRQYRRTLESKHRVLIYARGGEERPIGDAVWDDPQVTWGHPGTQPVLTAVDLEDFARWVTVNTLDIVMFNEQHWWRPVVLCTEMRIVVGAYVDYYTHETLPLFGLYDFLLCNTRRHYRAFDWHPRAAYVPWGTDVDMFRPRSFAAVHPGCVTFFHSAGMNPWRKGTDLVVRAFSRLRGRCRLFIHTQHSLECLSPGIDRLLGEMQDAGKASVHIGTVGAPGLYVNGDVYVYPSRLDGIGLSVAEALASGLPVIATDCPPMTEFVDAQNGRLVRVCREEPRDDGYFWPQCEVDLEDLVRQMQWFVDHDHEVPELKRAARASAETRMNWELNAAGVADLFTAAKQRGPGDKAAAVARVELFEREWCGAGWYPAGGC